MNRSRKSYLKWKKSACESTLFFCADRSRLPVGMHAAEEVVYPEISH
jgi:hypothetical protein